MARAAEMPGVEVVCVCDVDSRARDWAAKEVEKICGKAPDKALDIRKVLERKDIDGIVGEVPDHWHAPMAWMAMEAGKDVYIEKPCTFCPSEGEILINVQKKTGRVFQMGNQRRSSVAYARVIKEIRNGIIGEIKYARTWYRNNRKPIGRGELAPVPEWLNWDLWQGPCPRAPYRTGLVHYNWHWNFKYGMGEITNNAVHYVDVARWAMGLDMPCKVSAIGGRYCGDDDWQWPDTQMLSLEFPEGKMITWEGLSCLPGEKPRDAYAGAMVYGTKGSILFHPRDFCVMYDGVGDAVRMWKADDAKAGNNVEWKPKLDYWHMSNFVDAIRAHDPSLARSPVVDSVRSSHVSLLGNLSIRSGLTLNVDPVTGVPKEKAAMEFWGREYEPGWEHA
jgi:predicted dehydrogenase